MSATQGNAEAQAKTQQATEYVILREATESTAEGNRELWAYVGVSAGVNAQAAIKAKAQGEGTFIAVPARSWKPLTRKIEKVERDLWS